MTARMPATTYGDDAELAAIAGLTSEADKAIYFTGAGTAALTDITELARTLLAGGDEATMRSTLDVPGLSEANTFSAAQQLVDAELQMRPSEDANPNLWINQYGQLSWGFGTASADATLTHPASGRLQLNGRLTASQELWARTGVSSQVQIGSVGPSGEAGMALGSAADAGWYRAGAGEVKLMDDGSVALLGFETSGSPGIRATSAALAVQWGTTKFEVSSGVTSLKPSNTTMIEADATKLALYGGTRVAQASAIGKPSGGTTEDTEARAAIDSLIDALGASSGIGVHAG